MRVCVTVRVAICKFVCRPECLCMHLCACMCAFVRARMWASVDICERVCLSVCVCVCALVCVGERIHPPLSRAEADKPAAERSPEPPAPSTTLQDSFKTFLPLSLSFSRWRTKIERPQWRPWRKRPMTRPRSLPHDLPPSFLPYDFTSFLLLCVVSLTVRYLWPLTTSPHLYIPLSLHPNPITPHPYPYYLHA